MAVKRLRSGVPWHKSGVDSFGCGSIHRAPAIGAILWNNAAKRRDAAELQSSITHVNRDVCAASMLVADLVASLLRGACGPNCESVPISIPEGDTRLGPALARLPDMLGMRAADVLASIVPADGIADDVLQSLLWALYCALSNDWDFGKAVKLALRSGGELVAPTAIVGAMCGAVQGVGAFPSGLLDRLSNRGIFGKSEFSQWCTECFELTKALA